MQATLIQNIDSHIASTHGKLSIIVVYGPTASGKSSLAVSIAEYIRASSDRTPSILSADSRQIYRGMDIGTGKITPEEMRDIPHYGLDILSPNEAFSVAAFQRYGQALISSLSDRDILIICGGTGLYIDALVFERSYMGDAPDPERRHALEAYRREFGNEALWKKLFALDPEYAQELHPNNHTYIIRAIEVFEDTGKSKQCARNTPTLQYPTSFFTPYHDTPESRKALYEKIDQRVAAMFQDGLIDEVRTLVKTYGPHAPGLATIGYKEVCNLLAGDISTEEAQALVAQHSRNYAKRQISWNKKYLTFSIGII